MSDCIFSIGVGCGLSSVTIKLARDFWTVLEDVIGKVLDSSKLVTSLACGITSVGPGLGRVIKERIASKAK